MGEKVGWQLFLGWHSGAMCGAWPSKRVKDAVTSSNSIVRGSFAADAVRFAYRILLSYVTEFAQRSTSDKGELSHVPRSRSAGL